MARKNDGSTAAASGWWTGDNLKDDRTNAIAQLPVTGFVTAGRRVRSRLSSSLPGPGAAGWSRNSGHS